MDRKTYLERVEPVLTKLENSKLGTYVDEEVKSIAGRIQRHTDDIDPFTIVRIADIAREFRMEEAKKVYAEVAEEFEGNGWYAQAGDSYRNAGLRDKAKTAYVKSMKQCASKGDSAGLFFGAEAAVNAGEIAEELKQPEEAMELYFTAVGLYRKGGHNKDAVEPARRIFDITKKAAVIG